MKILFIIHMELGRPGMADMNYFMVKSAKLGANVGVICKVGGNEEDHLDAGVKIFSSASDGIAWFRFVRQAIQKFQPDVVHVSTHLGCGIYPLLSSLRKTKFLLDVRSPLLRTSLLRLAVVLKNQIELLGYDKILGHSVASAQTVVGKWHKDIEWVPPGVNLEVFRDRGVEEKRLQEVTRFVYIGSLQKIRKIDQMIKAFIYAANKADIILDVYGVGDAKDDLESMVSKAGLSDKLSFKGLLPRENLFNILPEYDFGVSYVPKSLFDPAPPLKTMEYLAAGLPVLATNTIGNQLFIEDGKNGYLADESVDTFCAAICAVDDKRNNFSDHHKIQSSVLKFDWDNIVREILFPIYKDCLNE